MNPNQPREVRIVQQDGRFQLWRDGAPCYVQGAVADPDRMPQVRAYGGNAIRTAPHDRQILDRAYALGLSVLCHLPVRAERDGMDYRDR